MDSKRKLIWIEREQDVIDTYVDILGLKNQVEVISCFNFDRASDLIFSKEDEVDIVILNYCNFYWSSYFDEGLNLEEQLTAVDFLESTLLKKPEIHFILFSFIAHTDPRLGKFNSLDNFDLIEKSQPNQLLSKITSLFQSGDQKRSIS